MMHQRVDGDCSSGGYDRLCVEVRKASPMSLESSVLVDQLEAGYKIQGNEVCIHACAKE